MRETSSRARPLWENLLLRIFLFLCMAGPSLALANGFLETTGGKRIEGKISIERGKLVVTPAAGEAATIPFEQLKRANFGREKVKAAAVVGEAPPEVLKAKTMEGLRGEYFAEHDMKDRRLVRVDRELNLWWGSAPDPAVPKGFAVRWTGQIEAKFTEKYTFEADLIGGMRMW